MVSRIQSLQNISVAKCAVLLCLAPELKREILCVPESEYSTGKLKYQYYRKEQWLAIVEKKGQELLKYSKLTQYLKDKVISLLPAIALRILMWSEYHEGILGLARCYSLNFLKFSHFTSQGIIDSKTAAEDMINDAKLNIKQKYKIACIYCFKNHISSCIKKIVRKMQYIASDLEDSKCMETPKIVKYWTWQLIRVVDNEYHNYTSECISKERESIISSITSGSIEAVKYFLDRTALISRDDALIFGVTHTLIEVGKKSDWIVFRDERFNGIFESWAPTYFYVDILCFLLSNMTKTQQQKALEKNISGYDSITVLELFLCWPYQDYFMKTAAVLWDLIPQNIYAVLLLKICDKMEPCKRKNLLYGEEKLYDYKKLLVDFWSQSPDHFKRYVFLNSPITYWNPAEVKTTTGIGLLLKLLSLKQLTYEEDIIWVILRSSTSEERGNLMSAGWWRRPCIKILKKENFEIFDRLLLLLCKSEQETNEFKEQLNLHKKAESICSNFFKYGKVNAVKSLIDRISLPDLRLKRLKEKVIYSDEGMQHCRKLLSSSTYSDFEEFIKWFLPSNYAQTEYTRDLTMKVSERFPVHHFSEREIRDFMTRFTRSKLPHQEMGQEIKTSFMDTFGRAFCEDLIAGSSVQVTYRKNSLIQVKSEFTGGQWGRVDELLRWSFSNDMQIQEFKKKFHELASTDVHFQLIKARRWEIAKSFLEWLPLTDVEVKAFKKRMMFDHEATRLMLHHLVFEEDDEMHNLKTIDLFLRWHLTDKESIIKFRDYFFDAYADFDEAGLKKFNSLIENYLDDLEEAESCHVCGSVELRFFRILAGGCVKQNLAVSPPRKKLRSSQCETESGQINKNGCLSGRRSQRSLNKSPKS